MFAVATKRLVISVRDQPFEQLAYAARCRSIERDPEAVGVPVSQWEHARLGLVELRGGGGGSGLRDDDLLLLGARVRRGLANLRRDLRLLGRGGRSLVVDRGGSHRAEHVEALRDHARDDAALFEHAQQIELRGLRVHSEQARAWGGVLREGVGELAQRTSVRFGSTASARPLPVASRT